MRFEPGAEPSSLLGLLRSLLKSKCCRRSTRGSFSIARIALLCVFATFSQFLDPALAGMPAMTVPGQFGVSASGAATYSIPIAVPPGTAGMVPTLTLDYSSQGADGYVGWQWSLDGLPSITHCARTVAQDSVKGGINYDTNDRFCLNGQRLLVISGTYGASGSVYRTEIESFSQVTAHGTAGNAPSYWVVQTKSGRTIELGNTTDSKVLAVGITTARAWMVDKITDSKGNYLTVTWTNDTTNGQVYPGRIDYTGNTGASLSTYNSVQFSYNTSRGDVTPTYQAGSLIQNTVLLTDIKTYQGSNLVFDYQLAYRAGSSTKHSRLTSVTLCDSTGTNCLAPTTFGWQGGTGQLTMTGTANSQAQGAQLFPLGSSAVVGNVCMSGNPIYIGFPTFTTNNGYLEGTETDGCLFRGGWQLTDVEGTGNLDVFAIESVGSGRSRVYNIEAIDSNALGGVYSIAPNNPTLPSILAGDFNGDGRGDFLWMGSACFGDGSGGWATCDSGHSYTGTLLTGDFDGDGCTDILNIASSSYVQFYCSPAVSTVTTPSLSGYTVTLGDFNGDGKTDMLLTSTTGAGKLYLSTGTGFVLQSGCSLPSGWGKYQIYTADINGDGKTDLVLIAPGGSGRYGVGTSHQLWVSTGSCFTQAVDTSNNPITISNTNALDTSVGAVVADWDGDGADDFWLKKPSGDTIYSFSYIPEMMTSVSNGIGATTTVTYESIDSGVSGFYTAGTAPTYPGFRISGPYYVVSQVQTSNGIGGNYTQTYTYSGAFGNHNSFSTSTPAGGASRPAYAGRVESPTGAEPPLLGFTQIAMTDSQTGLVTTTNYSSAFPYIGMVTSQTVATTSGSSGCTSGETLKSTTNTYQTVTNSSYGPTYNFVSLAYTSTSGSDCDGSSLPTVQTSYLSSGGTTGTSEYDTYGNPLLITTQINGTTYKIVTNTFTNDTTNWFLGQLTASTVEQVVGSSDVTRHFSYGHDSSSGLINQEIAEPSSSSLKLEKDYTLDSFGNRTETTISGNTGFTSRSTYVTYDSKGELVTATTNPLSQSDSSTYSQAFGELTNYTGIDGISSSASYDTFGRPTLATKPDGTKVGTSYAYCSGVNGGSATCPTYGAALATTTPYAADGSTQNGRQTITYFDDLGRVIRTTSQGFDGSIVAADTQYDSNLNVYKTSRPYFTSGGTAKWTTYTYDALGRVTEAAFPNSGDTTYAYHGLTASTTDGLSQTTTTTKNNQGLVSSVEDANSKTASYTYDAFGNLLTTTDPSGNVITNTFDVRGRKLTSADPDMGSWSYAYDALSALTSQTDAKSQTTTLGYDLMERLTSRSETSLYSTWTYGTSTTANVSNGKLTDAKACTNSGCSTVVSDRTISYDSTGRPYTSSLTTGGSTYTYTTSYDSNGRVSTVAYPSGFTRQNVYTTLSYLCSITDNSGSPTCTSGGGANVYWSANAADAELHSTQETAGNGVVTTNTFDANTGLLTNVRSGPSNSVAQLDFTYDVVGNLTYRSDDLENVYEYFCYDNLNRLTSYDVLTSSGSQTCGSLGGTVYSIGYNYLGNITSRSETGTNAYSWTYSYPASGSSSVQPHAVSSISGTVNGAANPNYGYDADGNQTCEYTGSSCSGSGVVRSISYTAFNMASTITLASTSISFTYDSEHNRINECIGSSCSTSSTTYLNDPVSGAMSEAVVSGSTTTWHDYIQVGSRIVAERFCSGSAPCSTGAYAYYFVGDHLGSTSVLTNQSGSVVERDSYDAWGRRRNPSNGSDDTTCSLTSATTRGFTDQEHIDAMCAINFNARIYDPTIGRFVSADSFMPNPLDGQSINRFSYAENNPLAATDPTGHFCGPNLDGGGGVCSDDPELMCYGDCLYSGMGPPPSDASASAMEAALGMGLSVSNAASIGAAVQTLINQGVSVGTVTAFNFNANGTIGLTFTSTGSLAAATADYNYAMANGGYMIGPTDEGCMVAGCSTAGAVGMDSFVSNSDSPDVIGTDYTHQWCGVCNIQPLPPGNETLGNFPHSPGQIGAVSINNEDFLPGSVSIWTTARAGDQFNINAFSQNPLVIGGDEGFGAFMVPYGSGNYDVTSTQNGESLKSGPFAISMGYGGSNTPVQLGNNLPGSPIPVQFTFSANDLTPEGQTYITLTRK